MKAYRVKALVKIQNLDGSGTYTQWVIYSGHHYKSKWEAGAEATGAMRKSNVLTTMIEEVNLDD